MPLKWLLFDLDNTLLDFDRGAEQSLLETFTEYRFSELDQLVKSYYEVNHRCWHRYENGEIDIPMLKRLRFQIFVEENDLEVDHAELNRKYLGRLSQQISEMEGARNLLNQSHQRFQLALVTNGFAEVQHPRIDRSGLRNYFKHIVISEEIGSNKPAITFFEHTFQLLKKPKKEEVMIIGDSLSSDIKGGNDYGIRTCWYNPKKQENTSDVKPDHTVQSLNDIPRLWD